ncbi:hypothetical protein [Acinetobacter sp.]|uniref:hypothetical protein n=1 Tax=Acinetobacter sp. TaxID=472 RepID=UPI0031D388C1
MVWRALTKKGQQPPHFFKFTWYPNTYHKILHWNFILLNLPAPFYFLNIQILIGLPDIPIFKNEKNIQTTEMDTVQILMTTSPQQTEPLQTFSIQDDCNFTEGILQCLNEHILVQQIKALILQKQNQDLSLDAIFQLQKHVKKLTPFNLGTYEQWQMHGQTEGKFIYRQQTYQLSAFTLLYYTRMMNLPLMNWYFYIRNIIQIENKTYSFVQIRSRFNQILQNKVTVTDLNTSHVKTYTTNVHFCILRVYPKTKTVNGMDMYLPREFFWGFEDQQQKIYLYAESRGDFKAGFGAGFIGSFQFTLKIGDTEQQGNAGFCEYIDCRPLKWQETNEDRRLRINQNLAEYACTKGKNIKN